MRMKLQGCWTDHAKRSCVMEDVLIKMSLHLAVLFPFLMRLVGTETKKCMFFYWKTTLEPLRKTIINTEQTVKRLKASSKLGLVGHCCSYSGNNNDRVGRDL